MRNTAMLPEMSPGMLLRVFGLLGLLSLPGAMGPRSAAQSPAPPSLPSTAGETLSGKPIVLNEAIRGHAVVLVVGFSKDSTDGCAEWAKLLRADPALSAVRVYQVAMLEKAPGFVRGMIKDDLRKGLSSSAQESFVIFTKDEKLWRSSFAVAADKEPYILAVNAAGQVRWRGHGSAQGQEAQLRVAVR